MFNLITTLFLALGPSQVCGEPSLTGWMYIEKTDTCGGDLEHVCDVDAWPVGWSATVCCSMVDPEAGCTFSPIGVCPITSPAVCGIVPEPDPEPWLCNPIGSLDAYVSDDDTCDLGELHVCTHGDTPPDPLVKVCCVNDDECRLVPGDEQCDGGEWLGCSHEG
jgi:hypothetical protein